MSSDSRAIRSIAILGDGIVGLSAAVIFARALPRVEIALVPCEADPAALADRMPGTLPFVARFHAAAGIDERELVRAGAATHRLGTRFERWSATGKPWFHGFGGHGRPANGVAFDKVWVAAASADGTQSFHDYSASAVLAAAGKFSHPSRDRNSALADLLYGLQLDPPRYRERLLEHARSHHVRPSAAALSGVERREDGGLEALLLEDGARVAADLFIDCSGPSARLLAEIDTSFEDWGSWNPCRHLLIRETEGTPVPVPHDRHVADEEGWTGEFPLRGRTLSCQLSSDRFDSVGGEAVPLRTGRRPSAWVANVLALGDAAVAIEPLHGMNLDLAQRAILLALELLPGRQCHPAETAEYNRRFDRLATRVRDFLALHYLRSGRADGKFWGDMQDGAMPDSLAHTLDQYKARGRLPFHEDESISRDSWSAALLGLGVIPRALDPLAAALPMDQVRAAMAGVASELAAIPARLPRYEDYLDRMR